VTIPIATRAIAQNREIRAEGKYDDFRGISRASVAWLKTHRFTRATLETHFSARPEQILTIARFANPKIDKPSGQTRTWAKIAAALEILYHEQFESGEAPAQDPASTFFLSLLKLNRSVQIETTNIRETIHLLDALTPKSRAPREFHSEVMSKAQFSEDLRESLLAYNEELRYLTVSQLDALDTCFRSRKLWLQGPAGSGKTVFAIEATYRALRAGSSVLFVFRSTQFRYILSRLLEPVAQSLYLLPHIDFMYLLRQVELHGHGSYAFWEIVEAYLRSESACSRSTFEFEIGYAVDQGPLVAFVAAGIEAPPFERDVDPFAWIRS